MVISHIAYGQQDSVAMSVDVERVTITGNRQIVSEADRYGNVIINTKQLFTMPRFAGAVDIVRMLQFSPGVVTSNDGDAAIHVRGSDAGQNLTLLNNAPVYSPAHLFNFFSVFNTAHISGATFIKSGMPVQYGSVLSSVLDVRTHSYIPKKFGIEGNVGLIESDLALQIPIAKKGALYLSGRHSYVSWLTALMAAKNKNMGVRYEFGDYGLTYVQDMGKVGKLVVNSHFNHDDGVAHLGLYDASASLHWWDSTSSAVLITKLGESVTMENTLYATIFNNDFEADLIGNIFDATAAITDIGVRNRTKWSREKVELLGGFDYAYRRIQPQSIASSIAAQEVQKSTLQECHESALFASVLYKPFRYLEIDAGARLGLYSIGGKEFFNPEPRVVVSLRPFSNVRIWAMYNTTVQYLQLVPQSNASFASDFYLGSTANHRPQISYGGSLGYSHSVLDNQLRWSVELYYRQMYNVLEFDARLNTMLSTSYNFDDYIHSGVGEAYGAEFMLSYSHPKVDIQTFYTLSRSIRHFKELNGGNPFASSADRPHNLSLMAAYKPTPHWTISATFLYATGGAYTAPTSIHMIGGAFVKEYGAYNAARLPDYHRLDLSVTYWFKTKWLRRSGINLSIYNVYMRKNPMLMSWDISEHDTKAETYDITVRGPYLFRILPSISWNFKF